MKNPGDVTRQCPISGQQEKQHGLYALARSVARYRLASEAFYEALEKNPMLSPWDKEFEDVHRTYEDALENLAFDADTVCQGAGLLPAWEDGAAKRAMGRD